MLARCNHSVDGERDFEMNDFGGERALAGEGAFVTGDAVGGGTLAVLDRYLHVIEASFGELPQSVQGDADEMSSRITIATYSRPSKFGGASACGAFPSTKTKTHLFRGKTLGPSPPPAGWRDARRIAANIAKLPKLLGTRSK